MKKTLSVLSSLFLLILIPSSLTSCNDKAAVTKQDINNLQTEFKIQQDNFERKLNDALKIQQDNFEKKLNDALKIQQDNFEKKLNDALKTQQDNFEKKLNESFEVQERNFNLLNTRLETQQKVFDQLKKEIGEINK